MFKTIPKFSSSIYNFRENAYVLIKRKDFLKICLMKFTYEALSNKVPNNPPTMNINFKKRDQNVQTHQALMLTEIDSLMKFTCLCYYFNSN